MRFAGAVDIGGTGTKIGIVGEDGSVVRRTMIPTNAPAGPLGLVDAIGTAFRLLMDSIDKAPPLIGVGVSIAGFLNRDHSAMIHNANLPLLREFPLRSGLEDRFSLDCLLEVDSNAASLAEYWMGAGRGATRLLGLTLGTGVGGAVIIDGALLRYTGECAGDVGHVIVDPKGRLCSCGAHGCLEAMANSAAVSERGEGRSPRDVINSAREGDEASQKVLAETGWWVGLGLASLVPLYAPDRIVIGGGIAAARELLLDATRASFLEHASPQYRDIEVAGSPFEGWEGMIGAASLFLSPLTKG
jgi:glucokinase